MTDAPDASVHVGGGFRRLAQASALFAVGSVTGKAIGALLLPVLTRKLTSAEFGRLDVLSTLTSALISILVVGLDVAAVRLHPELSPSERRCLYGTWFSFSTAVAGFAGIVCIVASAPLSRVLFDGHNETLGMAMVGTTTIVGTWLVISLTVLRSLGRAGSYAALTAGGLLLNAILAVVLLFHWQADLGAVMVAMAVSQTAAASIGILLTRHAALGRPSRVMAKGMLRLGLPLAPAVAATYLGEFGNRVILLHAAGPVEVGYLSVAVRFASVAVLVATGFQLAWQPRAFALGDSEEARARIAHDGRRISVLLCTAVVAIALVAPEAVRLVAGASYTPALPALGFQLVLALGIGHFTIAGMASALAKNMAPVGVAAVAGVGVGLAANVVLAPSAESAGTAAAMALGQAVAVVLAARWGTRRLPVGFGWTRIAVLSTSAIAAVLAITTLPHGTALLSRVAVAVSFTAIILLEGTGRAAMRRRAVDVEPSSPRAH